MRLYVRVLRPLFPIQNIEPFFHDGAPTILREHNLPGDINQSDFYRSLSIFVKRLS
jgi:hypothetical protein